MEEIRFVEEVDTDALLNQNHERSNLIETLNQSDLKPYQQRNRDLEIQTFLSNANNSSPGIKVRLFTIPSLLPYSKVEDISVLTPIRFEEMQVPSVHLGRSLLLRTITPSSVIVSVSTVVEDASGNVSVLSLFHFQKNFEEDPNHWIPEGTILVIKEPSLVYGPAEDVVFLYVCSPSDVVFKDPLVDAEYLRENGAPHWIIAPQSFLEYRQIGLDHYSECQFQESLVYFNRALFLMPGDTYVLVHKGLSLLQMKKFFRGVSSVWQGI